MTEQDVVVISEVPLEASAAAEPAVAAVAAALITYTVIGYRPEDSHYDDRSPSDLSLWIGEVADEAADEIARLTDWNNAHRLHPEYSEYEITLLVQGQKVEPGDHIWSPGPLAELGEIVRLGASQRAEAAREARLKAEAEAAEKKRQEAERREAAAREARERADRAKYEELKARFG